MIIGKEEVRVSLLADNRIVYLSDGKNSSREIYREINNFSNKARYKNYSK